MEAETIREAAEYVAKHTTVAGVPLTEAVPGAVEHMRAHVNLHEKEDVLKLFGMVQLGEEVSFNGKTMLV